MTKITRDPYFDNGKFFLILLVVFGHLLAPFRVDNNFIYNLYLFIYSFHMPAFIFISGFFSKSFPKRKNQIKNNFKRFILPYIFFQLIYSLFYWITGIKEAMSFNLIVPNWSLWFLLSSFFWKISLYLFSKLSASIGISISIITSLLIGYLPFIGQELTLQRTFVFLPFFVIGYYFKKEYIDLFKNSQWKKILPLSLLISFTIIYFTPDINKYFFFGSKPYEDFLNLVELGASVRLFSLILSIIGLIGFFSLIPLKYYSFTKLGKTTMVVYLFHGFFVRLLRLIDYPSYLNNSYFLVVLVLLIISILLVRILSSKYSIKIYSGLEETLNKLFL